MTQFIDAEIEYENGEYRFSCSDKHSQLKRKIFGFPKTRLSAAASATDTTLSVYSTTDFEPVPHGTSYSYLPSTSVIILKIRYQDGWEICSATGKTANSFTGVTRGLFGTVARAHALPSDPNEDNGVEVEYYPFLEMPVAKLVYALLTGKLLNQAGATLPALYHLGIPEADVNQASFERYPDWYNPADDTKGLIVRFEGGSLSEQDGKAFIESELLALVNAFLLVEAGGSLSLRRKVPTLSNSDYALELDENLIAKHGALRHDLNAVASKVEIRWNYLEFDPNTKGFYRRNVLNDSVAEARFPDTKPRVLSFKGLHASRHTQTTLKAIFESHRDAVASPPLLLSGVEVMPTVGFDIEVGDVFLVDLQGVNDYQDLISVSGLQRPFEVRRVTIDQIKDSVVCDFVGSSTSATQLSDDDGGSNVIPNSSYTSAGTNLTSVLSIDGSGFTTASGSLTGGTTTRTRFYYDGDLTISTGHTITFTGNIELWIKGHLTINGKLDGAGGGNATDVAGVLGYTRAQGGAAVNEDLVIFTFSQAPSTVITPQYEAIPVLAIDNDSGTLTGVPADLRGSGGPTGESSTDRSAASPSIPITRSGGAGGNGGGSVVLVCRGFSFGASGTIDVSGLNGTGGVSGDYVNGGGGGGGSPGGVIALIDGSAKTVPVLTGKVIADRGENVVAPGAIPDRSVQTTFDDSQAPWGGWRGLPAASLLDSHVRIQYVPVSRTPYEDVSASLEEPTSITATGVEGGVKLAWTNPTDADSWDLIEIHAHTSNARSGSSKIFEGRASEFFHKTDDDTTRYYWLRTRRASTFSDFTPATETTTITATPILAAWPNYNGQLAIVDGDDNKWFRVFDVTGTQGRCDMHLYAFGDDHPEQVFRAHVVHDGASGTLSMSVINSAITRFSKFRLLYNPTSERLVLELQLTTVDSDGDTLHISLQPNPRYGNKPTLPLALDQSIAGFSAVHPGSEVELIAGMEGLILDSVQPIVRSPEGLTVAQRRAVNANGKATMNSLGFTAFNRNPSFDIPRDDDRPDGWYSDDQSSGLPSYGDATQTTLTVTGPCTVVSTAMMVGPHQHYRLEMRARHATAGSVTFGAFELDGPMPSGASAVSTDTTDAESEIGAATRQGISFIHGFGGTSYGVVTTEWFLNPLSDDQRFVSLFLEMDTDLEIDYIGITPLLPSVGGDLGVAANPFNSHQDLTIGTDTNGESASFTVYANDGGTNRRARFFMDDATGLFGHEMEVDSGGGNYVINVEGTERFRAGSTVSFPNGDVTVSTGDLTVSSGDVVLADGNLTVQDGRIRTIQSASGTTAGKFENTNGTSPNGIDIDISSISPDNRTRFFIRGQDSTQSKFHVYSDGGAQFTGSVEVSGANLSVDSTQGIYLDGLGGGSYLSEYSPNQVQVVTGSVQAMRWESNQNVVVPNGSLTAIGGAVQVQRSDSTITNGTTSAARIDIRNQDSTAGNHSDLIFTEAGGVVTSKIVGKHLSHSTHGGEIRMLTRVTSGALTDALTIDSSQDVEIPNGNLTLGDGATNITPSGGNGHVVIEGSGYKGHIALDATGMYIGHNTSARSLVLQVNATDALTVDTSGRTTVSATNQSWVLDVDNPHPTNPFGMHLNFSGDNPDNRSNYFIRATDSVANKFYLDGS